MLADTGWNNVTPHALPARNGDRASEVNKEFNRDAHGRLETPPQGESEHTMADLATDLTDILKTVRRPGDFHASAAFDLLPPLSHCTKP